jgi:hypothetical protein
VLQPNPLKAGGAQWDAAAVRGKLESRAQDGERSLQQELERMRRDERERVTSQNAIDAVAAEIAVCAAVAGSGLVDAASARAVVERLMAAPLAPRAEVRGTERYREQWVRTCEQLLREW